MDDRQKVLAAKLVWVTVGLSITAYGITFGAAGGDASVFHGIVLIVLCLPVSLVAIPLLGEVALRLDVISSFPRGSVLVGNAIVIALGYLQWFVLLPWLIRRVERAVDGRKRRGAPAGEALETQAPQDARGDR